MTPPSLKLYGAPEPPPCSRQRALIKNNNNNKTPVFYLAPTKKPPVASHLLLDETLIFSLASQALKGLVLPTKPAALLIPASLAVTALVAQHSLRALRLGLRMEDVGWSEGPPGARQDRFVLHLQLISHVTVKWPLNLSASSSQHPLAVVVKM